MSNRYAVVNDQGHIVNVIIWDGVSPWSPPAGHTVVRSDDSDIGDRWDNVTKEIVKPCRLHGCEHASHATDFSVHETHRIQENKELS